MIEWPQFIEKGLPLDGKFSSMTIGIFDGVHRGHQALIERIVSHNDNYVPAVITFRQNHKGKNCAPGIQTFQQKAAMLKSLGVKILLVIDFTESFSRTPGIEFLEILLKHGNTGFFAVGNGFRCGYRLDTGAAEIKNFFISRNIAAEIVPKVMEGSLPISSSRIRAAAAAGDFRLAETMLGRPVKE